jgi:MFS family permease
VERKWWTLLASCIAIFMLLLDVTIVNVALPSIERDSAPTSATSSG